MLHTTPLSTGIKSLSTAFRILEIVAASNGPISLKLIASDAGVAASKAHRYAQSLCALGYLNQVQKSGSYDLGIKTMQIGLSAVNRIDVISRASEDLAGLAHDLDADAFISVWTELGPTVIRYERGRHPVTYGIGLGTPLPLFNSAVGSVFLAFGGSELIAPAKLAKWRHLDDDDLTKADFLERGAQIRKAGYAVTTEGSSDRNTCVACPILSFDDKIIAVVAFISSKNEISEKACKKEEMLKRFCHARSFSKFYYGLRKPAAE